MQKFNYVAMSFDEGRHSILKSLQMGSDITLWEAGKKFRYQVHSFQLDPQSIQGTIVKVIIQQNDFPVMWNFCSLLFHIQCEGVSYLGKALCESHGTQGEKILTFDLKIFMVDRRVGGARLKVYQNQNFYLKLRLIDPPVFIREPDNNNVVGLFKSSLPHGAENGNISIWKEFLDLVKRVAKTGENKNEVYINYPIIDISFSGLSIPVTETEGKYFLQMDSLQNSATVYLNNDSIDIPRLKFVHTLIWNGEFLEQKQLFKAGLSFDHDHWVKKQLEFKLKKYFEDVEESFDQLMH